MKEELRKKYLIVRRNILNKDMKSHYITTKIINNKKYKEAKVIALYKSLKNEVDTTELINYSLSINKTVLLPKVENDDLVFYKIEKDEQLVKSNFNIEEPVSNEKKIIKDIDLIIVPGIAFDKRGYRIGFGKGYYDRYLKDKTIYKIGICFCEQIIKEIPTNEFDIPVDEIINDMI